MISVEGNELSLDDADRVKCPFVGGVILFSRNYSNKIQMSEMIKAIRSLRDDYLLIAVDQEGGSVQRFKNDLTVLPSAEAIGNLYKNNPEYSKSAAYAVGFVMAAELRNLGIDFSFAPVVEKASSNRAIGDRAFNKNENIANVLSESFCRGVLATGMAPIIKHFPGHSGVINDPHIDLPIDYRSLHEILNNDISNFRNIKNYLYRGVMNCHVVFPCIDDKPASLSDKILSFIRSELNFNGAIFSDDLMMGALKSIGDPAQRVKMALSAGSDMVLLCNNQKEIDMVLESSINYEKYYESLARLSKTRIENKQPIDLDILNGYRCLINNL